MPPRPEGIGNVEDIANYDQQFYIMTDLVLGWGTEAVESNDLSYERRQRYGLLPPDSVDIPP